MKVHSSRADEQDLGGQRAEPADEYDSVKIDDRWKEMVGSNTAKDFRHESHQDSEPEQRHHQQEEIAIPATMIGEHAAALRRRHYGSDGTPW